MIIREYQSADCKELTELFYNTVHTVNVKDYTKEQLDVWATGHINLEKWNQSFQEHFSIVAVNDDIIVAGESKVLKKALNDSIYIYILYT